jgi:glycosyltransferase involved in cell wall biosynthesis
MLAEALAKNVNVSVLHQGPTVMINGFELVQYSTLFKTKASTSLKIQAINIYTASILSSLLKAISTKLINEKVDIVQIETPHPFLITYNALRCFKKNRILISLDEHNVEFISVKSKINGFSPNSLLTTVTLPYVFLIEKLAVKNADVILCTSQTDQKLLMKLYGISKNKLAVIPNGVNFDKFEKARPVNSPLLKHNETVFFHGTLSWYPNLEAANIIVDYLAPKMPDATFLIAGSNPPASFIKKINKTENVKYLGFLNNLEGWIKSSDVCIAPIFRGGGTKLKVLEYAAAGKPIVATYKAVEGLPFINGVHALLFKDVNKDFLNAIKRVLSDEALAEKLGSNAKRLALNFDWKEIASKLYCKYALQLGE